MKMLLYLKQRQFTHTLIKTLDCVCFAYINREKTSLQGNIAIFYITYYSRTPYYSSKIYPKISFQCGGGKNIVFYPQCDAHYTKDNNKEKAEKQKRGFASDLVNKRQKNLVKLIRFYLHVAKEDLMLQISLVILFYISTKTSSSPTPKA